MKPATVRMLSHVILVIGIVLLLVTVTGMAGLLPRLAAPKELVLVSAVLIIAARGLRRRAARSAV